MVLSSAVRGVVDSLPTVEAGSGPILLVEDDHDHAVLVRRALAASTGEADLVHVNDSEAALDYLLRRGEHADPRASPRPRLILLDLRLPGRDGFHVLETVKTTPRLQSIPTVVLTTSNAESDVERALAAHANGYLVKPADFERFVAMVESVQRYWLGWNRQPGGEGAPPGRA